MSLKARLLSTLKETIETETITITTLRDERGTYLHRIEEEGYSMEDVSYQLDLVMNSHIEMMEKSDVESSETSTKVIIERVYRFGILKDNRLRRKK